MPSHEASRNGKALYLPQSLIATAAVTLIPLAVIWGLRAAGTIPSPWVCIPVAVAVSLAVSAIGSAYWKRRRPASELLFAELMLWSWVRRRRSERTIADANRLLREVDLTPDRREHLLRQVAASIEAQDPYTVGHSHRVARHSAMVARKLGLTTEEARKIRAAAAIHDVGKLRVAPQILHKPGMLSDAEYEEIKHHSAEGAALVSALGDDQLTAIVRHHHERLDGTGYPAGLAGEAIPLGARIVAVADTFDAITSARPYRPARAHKQALDILREEAGQQLDGRVVEAFIACYAGKRAVAAWATLSSLPEAMLARIGPSAKATGQPRVSPTSALSSTTAVAVAAGVALAAPVASHHRHRAHTPAVAAVFAAAPVLHPATVKAAHRTHQPPPAIRSPFTPVVAPPTPAASPTVHKQLAAATPLVYTRQPVDATTPVPAPRTPTPAPPTTTPPTPTTTPPTPTPTTPAPPRPTTTTTTTPATPAAPTSTSSTTTTTVSPVSTTTTTTTTVSPVSTTTTTTTTTITTSSTTSTTTSTTGDRCKDGGYFPLGYPHQGECESSRHRHHPHDH